MSWRKYFNPVQTDKTNGSYSPIGGMVSKPGPARANYSSFLPEVYTGAPNRVERYLQYDTMDMDSEVNAALDILAEFCSQRNRENQTPFQLYFKSKATSSEISILREYLQQWCKMQKFDTRIFRIVRNVFKYGDAIFIRDPENKKWSYVDPTKLVKIIVNESDGKEPEQYVIKDINPNFKNLVTTTISPGSNNLNSRGTSYIAGGAAARGMVGTYPTSASTSGSRFAIGENENAIDAKHIVHISLSEGLDNNFPFGNSLLESVFKVFKQKELLEDAILIYRIQRAPERRIFYIDVGNMPTHLAMSYVERVKNEIHQRRIPSATGGSGSMNVVDSSFNPMSQMEDYFFPQSCIAMHQKVNLLDNRDLTLQEIIEEYEQGIENYTYTVNQKTLELEPGKIVWAGKTRLNAQLVEVLLDNGEKVITTPDHRYIMRDGSEVEAQYLKEGDSLMPLYLSTHKTSKYQHEEKYLRYICPSNGKKKWVHTMVCPKTKPGIETEIHHKDLNSLNNHPSNLIEMDTKEHRELHTQLGSYHLTKAWKDPEKREKLVNGIRNYHANATEKDKEMMSKRGKKNALSGWNDPVKRQKLLEQSKRNQSIVARKRKIQYSIGMWNRLLELYNNGFDSISKLKKVLREDNNFQYEYHLANPNIIRDKNKPSKILPTDTTLNSMAKIMGYKGWDDFKKTYKVNHKVVSVTWLEEREDTGDITIESPNGFHNFALTAGIFIHNSEGRGSKVETLPGGTQLSEIDDLRYFTNKLFRGLRIPSSYLPTGADDSNSQYNDGRVGTAYIQELRFNNYCIRLQTLMQEIFDSEFKLYLYDRGVNIDSSLFELKFQPPQNFATYRQAELDNQRAPTFSQMIQVPVISKRFALKRFLGLSDEELVENERLWAEENGKGQTIPTDSSGELRGVGVSPAGIQSDMSAMADVTAPEGMETPGVDQGGAAQPGAEPAAEVPSQGV